MSIGRVIKNTGNLYWVENVENQAVIECSLKGRIRLNDIKTTNPIAVGDLVEYESEERANMIVKILPRENYIIRRSSNLSKEAHIIASNLDQAFVVTTLTSPKTSFEFIDRFLVTAEAYHVKPTIILNKTDIYTSEELLAELEYFRMIYSVAGYKIIEISADKEIGLDKVRQLVNGKISLFTGNSGVGKSTLIGKLIPNLKIRTGAISEYHNRGKHTTTFSEMYALDGGGYIIDTPGIKGFGIVDIEHEEICRYFPDIFKYSPKCQFYNCTHTHEPQCAVKEAIQDGKISDSRYMSYLKLMEDGGKYRR